MYPQRRPGRRRSRVDRDWDADADYYLDWVPDDREYIPKFRIPVVPLVILGLVIGLIVAARMSAHTTFMQQAFGGGHHHQNTHQAARPATRPKAAPRPAPSPSALPASPAGVAAMDCTITVPANPLSATGLATPYQLGGGCSEATPNLQAFVQATILDPATGALAVYEPLVVTAGTAPAVAPAVPALPADAVISLLFGFNGNVLTLTGTGTSLSQGNCVSGTNGSPFGQVSYCNAAEFFRAANAGIVAGKLKIPALGTANDGLTCPTTRSFTMVDQDQSDNVTSRYLLTANGRTAQDNAANLARLHGAGTAFNGSDNALLDYFLDPALGCAPMTAPDLSNPGHAGTSQALDELEAAANQAQPVALTPVSDPMTMANGAFSIAKTNLYRQGVDQPLLPGNANPVANAQAYCTDLVNIQTARLDLDKPFTTGARSPVPSIGTSLFTFLAARLASSFGNLNCQKYGLVNPVTLTMNGSGAATAAVLNIAPQAPDGSPLPLRLPPSPKAAKPNAPDSPAASATGSPAPSPAG